MLHSCLGEPTANPPHSRMRERERQGGRRQRQEEGKIEAGRTVVKERSKERKDDREQKERKDRDREKSETEGVKITKH